eukprot:scaffold791_cov115-Cylindrotheca_fusiformis.AAC.4
MATHFDRHLGHGLHVPAWLAMCGYGMSLVPTLMQRMRDLRTYGTYSNHAMRIVTMTSLESKLLINAAKTFGSGIV